MNEPVIMLALAIFPVVILVFYVYRKDKFDKEPLGMLIKAFCFGCLSAVPAIFLEGFLGSLYTAFGGNAMPGIVDGIYNGYIVAGFSEELCKLLLLMMAVWRSRHFNEYFDGIVYATFVSLGFAGLENILYVFQQDTFSNAIMTGSVRALLSVPGHFLFGVAMGYYLALAKFQPERRRSYLFKALLYPMLLHGTFDALLMIPEAMGEEGAWTSAILFPLFIYFDIRMWKAGIRKLRALQEMSEQQAYDTPNDHDSQDRYDDSYNHYNDYGNGNGAGNDTFSGFRWDV